MKPPRRGEIELICGPMFGGKTTRLIECLTQARSMGQSVITFKPGRDTRYSVSEIVSHTHRSFDAVAIEAAGSMIALTRSAELLAIDELHFFQPDIADVLQQIIRSNLAIVAAGVDYDHRGRIFPAVAATASIANRVTRVTATCTRCGAEAKFTQRMTGGDEPIVVGGAGDYEPRCTTCFDPDFHPGRGAG